MLNEALELPFEQYMEWCRHWVADKASRNPVMAILLTYPGATAFLEASWAKRYWFHRCARA